MVWGLYGPDAGLTPFAAQATLCRTWERLHCGRTAEHSNEILAGLGSPICYGWDTKMGLP